MNDTASFRFALSIVILGALFGACDSDSNDPVDSGARDASSSTDAVPDDADVFDGSSRDAGAVDAAASDAESSVDASGAILSFRFGNQITGSTLEIEASGAYARGERTCCPPTTAPSAGSLTPLERTTLLADIALIAAAGTETIEGMPTTMGSASGVLEVRSGGTSYIVQDVVRNAGSGSDIVTRSTAATARNSILDLVDAIVDFDAYRLP